jgi:hypothetical protein
MVDIAKCSRKDCEKRGTCFRYLADSEDYYQSYIVIGAVDVEDGCNMYWQCRNPKELAYMNKVNK